MKNWTCGQKWYTRTEIVDKLKSWKYYNSPSSPGLRPSTCGCSVRFCCCLSLFLKLLSENTVSRYHRAPPRIYLVGALRAGWQLAYPVECSEVRWANYLHDKYLCQSLWAVELSTQIASSTWTYSSMFSSMVTLWSHDMWAYYMAEQVGAPYRLSMEIATLCGMEIATLSL